MPPVADEEDAASPHEDGVAVHQEKLEQGDGGLGLDGSLLGLGSSLPPRGGFYGRSAGKLMEATRGDVT